MKPRKGMLHGAEPLAPITTATTVRIQGQALVTDGPFAETKEHLAGYYILECENLDEAIEWAARIPTSAAAGKAASKSAPCRGYPRLPCRTMDDIRSTVDAVFRQESGRIIAGLIRFSGSFDRAEEAMQEALVSALSSWGAKGIPENPAAWIMTAANRKLIDALRKERTRLHKQDSLTYEIEIAAATQAASDSATMDYSLTTVCA